MNKEWSEFIQSVLARGWRQRRSTHGVVLLHPSGRGAVTLHRTPSDRRAMQNTRAQVRRIERSSST